MIDAGSDKMRVLVSKYGLRIPGDFAIAILCRRLDGLSNHTDSDLF
jgi:hypothetical protein